MRSIALLLVGLAIGWAASSIEWTPDAIAQENILRTPDARDQVVPPLPADPLMPEASLPKRNMDLFNDPSQPATAPAPQAAPVAAPTPAPPSGRFQISAYGSPHGHGCYVVDTATGATWHFANGQPPEQLTDRLPPLITKDAPQSEAPSFSVPAPNVEPAPHALRHAPRLPLDRDASPVGAASRLSVL